MTKCKNPSCTNEVVSIEGRRPKEFCSVECRTKFHNAKNFKGTGRGRTKGAKNKPKMQYVLPQPIPEVVIGQDSVTVTKDVSVMEIRKKFGDEYGDKAEKLLAVYHLGKEPTEDVIALADEMAKIYNIPVMKESINELVDFGTVTTKTEIVDGKVKSKVVDKKKIIDEKTDEPKSLADLFKNRTGATSNYVNPKRVK